MRIAICPFANTFCLKLNQVKFVSRTENERKGLRCAGTTLNRSQFAYLERELWSSLGKPFGSVGSKSKREGNRPLRWEGARQKINNSVCYLSIEVFAEIEIKSERIEECLMMRTARKMIGECVLIVRNTIDKSKAGIVSTKYFVYFCQDKS